MLKHQILKFSLIIFLSISALCLGTIFYIFDQEWIDLQDVEFANQGKPSVVLDDEDKVIFQFKVDKREWISFEKMPSIVIKAFLAAEDHQFFEHSGISPRSMLRSFLTNIKRRRVVQGASTITQQLVKLQYLSHDRTFMRKAKEIFLSLQLERQLTKEQILEHYLNSIYFGRGIYGVEAASRRFWDKSLREVTPAEAATLASVAKSARFYSPLNDLANAQRRRDIILKSMYQLRYISQEEYLQNKEQKLDLQNYIQGNGMRLYIQEWIRNWAEGLIDRNKLYYGGLKIKTTINLSIQEAAEKAFRPVVLSLRQTQGESLNGGMIAIESSSGKIKSFVGGIDYAQSQFNRAFQAVRQMGSAFKPIVYAAALQNGYAMRYTATDEPLTLDLPNGNKWEPRNWQHTFEGKMTLLKALTTSNNIVTIKTLLAIGYDPVISLAQTFGIRRALNPFPSLALGTAEATVEETAAAFNVFANHGIYVKPYLIEWVKDEWGNKIWEQTQAKRVVLDSKIASQMVSSLAVRMKKARAKAPNVPWINAEAIGKSGSTNNSVSTWFVGSTPELTTAVYIGRDDNKGMGTDIYGSQTSYPIWFNFNKSLTFKSSQFYYDPSCREITINWDTGASEKDCNDPDAATLMV